MIWEINPKEGCPAGMHVGLRQVPYPYRLMSVRGVSAREDQSKRSRSIPYLLTHRSAWHALAPVSRQVAREA